MKLPIPIESFPRRVVPADEIVFFEGQPGDTAYVILKGEVEVAAGMVSTWPGRSTYAGPAMPFALAICCHGTPVRLPFLAIRCGSTPASTPRNSSAGPPTPANRRGRSSGRSGTVEASTRLRAPADQAAVPPTR